MENGVTLQNSTSFKFHRFIACGLDFEASSWVWLWLFSNLVDAHTRVGVNPASKYNFYFYLFSGSIINKKYSLLAFILVVQFLS